MLFLSMLTYLKSHLLSSRMNATPFSCAAERMGTAMRSMTSLNETVSLSSVNLSLSSFDIMRVSFTRSVSSSAEICIFFRYPFMSSASSELIAISVNPIMPFNGVRISWLMFPKNSFISLLVRSATRRACCCCLAYSCSCLRSFSARARLFIDHIMMMSTSITATRNIATRNCMPSGILWISADTVVPPDKEYFMTSSFILLLLVYLMHLFRML